MTRIDRFLLLESQESSHTTAFNPRSTGYGQRRASRPRDTSFHFNLIITIPVTWTASIAAIGTWKRPSFFSTVVLVAAPGSRLAGNSIAEIGESSGLHWTSWLDWPQSALSFSPVFKLRSVLLHSRTTKRISLVTIDGVTISCYTSSFKFLT